MSTSNYIPSVSIKKHAIVKSPRILVRGLSCDRQQSILPGRFQPSTFNAWELNCCVRDGNRWYLSAIITGSLDGLFRLLPRQPAVRSVDIPQYDLPSLPWPSLHKTGKSSSVCFRSSQTLNTVQKKLLAKKLTRLALSALPCFQIKPSTD